MTILETCLLYESLDILLLVNDMDSLSPIQSCRLQDPHVLAREVTHRHYERLAGFGRRELGSPLQVEGTSRTFILCEGIFLKQPVHLLEWLDLVSERGLVHLSIRLNRDFEAKRQRQNVQESALLLLVAPGRDVLEQLVFG